MERQVGERCNDLMPIVLSDIEAALASESSDRKGSRHNRGTRYQGRRKKRDSDLLCRQNQGFRWPESVRRNARLNAELREEILDLRMLLRQMVARDGDDALSFQVLWPDDAIGCEPVLLRKTDQNRFLKELAHEQGSGRSRQLAECGVQRSIHNALNQGGSETGTVFDP